MPGKTDNADADYYIPRRPIHSGTRRVCVHIGLPGVECVRRAYADATPSSRPRRRCMDTYVISLAVIRRGVYMCTLTYTRARCRGS